MWKQDYPAVQPTRVGPWAVAVITLSVALWALIQGVQQERRILGEQALLIALSESAEPAPDLPDFNDIAVVQERKDQFYDFLLPIIAEENARLLEKRAAIEAWYERVRDGQPLPEGVVQQLIDLSARYYVDTEQALEAVLDELLLKIDILPPSLIVAQAANESAWGTSRFAREGNNLFGQWCFSQGCGLVPESRPDGEIYEVRSFEAPVLSVRSFIQNLNRHFSYETLREHRAWLRANDEPITGLELAPHLLAYSTRREAYVAEIEGMIRFNNLQDLD